MRETLSEPCRSSHKSYSVLLSNRTQTLWVEKNQSSQPCARGERDQKWEPWEADYCDGLKSALRKATSYVCLSNQKCICITFSRTCGCLEGTLVEEPLPPPDFREFDILMNRCIFRGATIQSERHIINWIAAVKSKSFSESTELSGTDSLCPQGCASFQLRKNSQQY